MIALATTAGIPHLASVPLFGNDRLSLIGLDLRRVE